MEESSGPPAARRGKRFTFIVVGGGLVGSLCASALAKRGHSVQLYEYRDDPRLSSAARGRSINLAMSRRARAALRRVGLEEALLRHGIPMRGRLVHAPGGGCREIPYDPNSSQCIYSVGRKFLNDVLLSAAEKYPNVELYFGHKMVDGDLEEGRLEFERGCGSRVQAVADAVVGADGAFSSVRRLFMKRSMFQYNQTYIEHAYLELRIPPTTDGQFAMPPNFLHIWPRGTFMMIALPNQDRSWTVTLFMPFSKFEAMSTPDKLLQFFRKYFADAVPLLGEANLVKDFFGSKPQPLVSIKCRPYHAGRALLLGDAAHAMVPFYGQGMNAGFEDVRLFTEMLEDAELPGANLFDVMRAFSSFRNPDAESICDLAMYNYIEMRDLVNRSTFLARKKLDTFLYRVMPDTWVPLYNSVTFSDMRYSQCVKNKEWQDRMIHLSIILLGAFGVTMSISIAFFL